MAAASYEPFTVFTQYATYGINNGSPPVDLGEAHFAALQLRMAFSDYTVVPTHRTLENDFVLYWRKRLYCVTVTSAALAPTELSAFGPPWAPQES